MRRLALLLLLLAPACLRAQIPPTLGWYQIPNTAISGTCPTYTEIQANEGCPAVMADWAGGMWDSKRNRFVIMGGGHNGYYGNEIYGIAGFSGTAAVTLVHDATHNPNLPSTLATCNGTNCPDSYLDNTVSSRHNYAGLVYIPMEDEYCTMGGIKAGAGGGFSNTTWCYTPSNSTWTEVSSSGPTTDSFGTTPEVAYDPLTGQVFSQANEGLTFNKFNPGTSTWTFLANSSVSCSAGGDVTAAIDPVRRIYICVGSGGFVKTSLNSPYASTALTGTGCSTLVASAAPGFVYYPIRGHFIGWAGGNTLYEYNPDTDSCSTITTYSGGPPSPPRLNPTGGTYPAGSAQANGTYGRFQYDQADGVFLVANDIALNTYSLRLDPAPVQSFTLTSPNTGVAPFDIGLGFKDGDIPSGTVPSLSISPSQCVVTRAWNDGSAKLALCSGVADLVANTAYTISVSAGQSQGGTAMTCSNITSAAPSASVQLGSIGTVTLSSLLSSPFRTWVSGSQMVECDYLKPEGSIGSDANLQVWFNVRLYSTGQMWVQVVVENPGMDVATVDKNYIPTVTIGGTVVYNNGGSSLDHASYSRWVEEGWIGTNPQVTPAHSTTYLEASKLIPNYLNLTPPSSPLCGGCPSLSTQTQTYTPMALGDGDPNESDTGYQTQIGLLPLWDALWATSGADPRAYNALIANAKAQNTFPIVWNVSTTHLTPRPSDWLTWSIAGSTGNGPPATANGAGTTDVSNTYTTWDVAHHPSAGYLAYILTGQHFYLEEMADESAMCYLVNSSSHGSGDNRTIAPGTVQDRGQAWCFRTMMQYAAIAPSGDTVASDYASLLSNSVGYLNTVASTASPIGYVLNWDVAFTNGNTDGALPNQTIYDWEEDFLEMTMGMGTDVQPLSSMTAWQQLETFVMQVPVGKLGPGTTGQSGYPFTRAAQHHFIITNTVSGSPATYFSTWQSVLTNNETGGLGNPPVLTSTVGWTGNISGDANTLQCGVESNPPNDNCSSTDPANAAGGYWGNLLPTIAYAVSHNMTGAAAAEARLTGATNYATMLSNTNNTYGGFASTPTWGIVPVASAPPSGGGSNFLSGTGILTGTGTIKP
jgi:hypothetical protein